MRCSSLRWRMLRIRARLLIDGLAAEGVMAVFHDATNRFICEFNLGRPCLCLSSLSTCWTASPVCPPESQRSHRHRSNEHNAAISDLDCWHMRYLCYRTTKGPSRQQTQQQPPQTVRARRQRRRVRRPQPRRWQLQQRRPPLSQRVRS